MGGHADLIWKHGKCEECRSVAQCAAGCASLRFSQMCPGDRNWLRLPIDVHWSHESERECRELEEGLRTVGTFRTSRGGGPGKGDTAEQPTKAGGKQRVMTLGTL